MGPGVLDVVCALIGGALFVRGAGLVRLAWIPTHRIGVTVALRPRSCGAALPPRRNPCSACPTPQVVVEAMLNLAAVRQNDVVSDLGSGAGRIPITAAQRGARGLGVETVPDLVRQSQENARVAGVQGRVKFRTQDLFQTDLSSATVVTPDLLPDVNLRLRDRLLGLRPGTRAVSHDFDMDEWRADRTVTVQGPAREHTVSFWNVPARAAGTWTFTRQTPQDTLRPAQEDRRVTGQLSAGGQNLPVLDTEFNGKRWALPFMTRSAGSARTSRCRGGSAATRTANAVIVGGAVAGTRQLTANPTTTNRRRTVAGV